MAQRHSTAERLKLKNVLRDAIRVLCQSTVRFKTQLSVEALVGITVDGGSDFLILSLNELIDTEAIDATFTSGHHYEADADAGSGFDDGQYADMQADGDDQQHDEYMENSEYWEKDNGDDAEYDDGEEESDLPYGTVIKEELTSTIMYNDGTQSDQRYQQSGAVPHAVKAEPYPYTVKSEAQYYPHPEAAPQQSFGSQQAWSSVPRQSPHKPQMRGFGAQKRPATKPATTLRKKSAAAAGSKQPPDVGRAGQSHRFPMGAGQSQPVNGEDGVSQITLYTCGTCGAQMQTKHSLLRHKQTHTGHDLCRCQGCQKIIKRRDNLLKHQSRCPAYLSLLQQGGVIDF